MTKDHEVLNNILQPSEGKREEFRRYLEKTGVMDALTKVLVALYEEPDKPENAIEYPYYTNYEKKLNFISLIIIRYICNNLSNQLCGETLTAIKGNLEEAMSKIAALEQENLALKAPLGGEDEAAAEGESEAAEEAAE